MVFRLVNHSGILLFVRSTVIGSAIMGTRKRSGFTSVEMLVVIATRKNPMDLRSTRSSMV